MSVSLPCRAMEINDRHCERSDATQIFLIHALGCFVVTFLAMTNDSLESNTHLKPLSLDRPPHIFFICFFFVMCLWRGASAFDVLPLAPACEL